MTTPKQSTNNTALFIFSLSIGYITSFFFGFHLTSIEIIRNIYFTDSYPERAQHYYYIAALPFIFPVLSNISRAIIPIEADSWIGVIHFFHSLAFICLIFNNTILFYIGKAFAGFAIGLSATAVPEYVGRLRPDSRGILTYLFQTFIIVGILSGQILTIFVKTPLISKISFFSVSIIALLSAFFTKFIYSTNQTDQSDQTDGKDQSKTHKTISDLLSNSDSYKSIGISLIIHMAQQFSCINGILTYSNSLLKENEDSGQKRTIVMGIFSLFCTFIASFFIEWAGRKTLLQLSNVIVILGLSILLQGKYPLIALLVFQFGFCIGLGPVTWLLTSEIFPTEYQPVASPICSIINWVLASLTVLYFEKLFQSIGNSILYFNIAVLSIFTVVLYFQLTETKGQVKPTFQS